MLGDCESACAPESAYAPEKKIPFGALHSFGPEELPQLLEQTVRRCLAKHEQIQEARLQDLLREEHVNLNVTLMRVSSQIANSASSNGAREDTAMMGKLDELEAKVDRLVGILGGAWRDRDEFLAEQTREIVRAVVAEKTAPMIEHLERLSVQPSPQPMPKGQAAKARPLRLTSEQHSQTCESLPDAPWPAAKGGGWASRGAAPALEEAPPPPGSGDWGSLPLTPLPLPPRCRVASPGGTSAAPGEMSPGSSGKGGSRAQHRFLRMLQRRGTEKNTDFCQEERRHSIQEHKLRARTSSWLERVVHSYLFEVFFVGVVVMHLIYLIIQTDLSFGAPQTSADYILSESCFVVAYTIELAMKLSADGWQIFCGPNHKANLLDLFLIVTACVDIISHLVVNSGAVNTMALKGARMLRLQKMLRLHKIFGMTNDTQLLLQGLRACSGVLVGAALIFCLYFLVGSIFFTQAVSAYVLESRAELSDEQIDYYEHNFGSVLNCMFTLYRGLKSGGEWMNFYDALKPVWGGELLALVFIVFNFIYAVLMVNVVSSVYVQKILLYSSDQSQSIRFRQQRNDRKDTQFLLEQCEKRVGTGDTINYKDFLKMMHVSEEVREVFDVRAVALEDATALHKLLARKPPGEDTPREWMWVADRSLFFDMCMRLKRDVSTTDVARSTEEFHRFVRTQHEQRDRVEAALAIMKNEITSISHTVKRLRSGP